MKNIITNKYTLLVVIALIWGSQFMFNAIVLKYFNPEGVALFRAIIGFLTLTLVIPLTPERKNKLTVSKRNMGMLFVIGFFEATMPFYLVAYGQQDVLSSVTSILMATIALFTMIMVILFVRHEKIGLFKIMGLILGFIGVAILLSPDLLHSGPHLFGNLKGELAILGGAFCFAVALVMIRLFGTASNPIRTARAILFSGIIQLGIISLVAHQPLWHHTPNAEAIGSLLILGMFAAGLVYVLYVRLITTSGASFAGFTNYLVPLVGVFVGTMFLGEAFHMTTAIALVVIIAAMVICEIG